MEVKSIPKYRYWQKHTSILTKHTLKVYAIFIRQKNYKNSQKTGLQLDKIHDS